MINVKIDRANDGTIQSFTMSGHAYQAAHGQDIVCAGASAVSIGTINAIYALTNTEPIIQQQDGYLYCEVPSNINKVVADKIQLLLEGMLVSLKSIEQEYGDYIKITKQ
ncbi:ribosomal-processing cysteine protease Prp [Cytobacillus sp. IB215665]|uniref:ribosomal-processing cysteine protease Prp n=1 Tax=Cytobacillus sp. IB215665 TaxID=3097357 RepID=UPI002A10A10D|nr:ribosomal-processing cysteine protease Prp [Cytobacillus sp. IB215665]MDX8364061.1 ribosomal-processing cysteine protease Prp [Cytobacillus sp. IB215665]